MYLILVIATGIASSYALFQCPPNYCDGQVCAELTSKTCLGVIKTGGSWCGCCDVCVKQLGEGESCFRSLLLGAPATEECMTGLHCDRTTSTCVRDVVKRQVTASPCERRRQEIQQSKLNGLPLLGVDEPNCDSSGYYAPKQCTGSVCYCVDKMGVQLQTYQTSIANSANMNCQCAIDQANYMSTGLIGKLYYCDVNGNYRPGGQTQPVVQTQPPLQTQPPVTLGPVVQTAGWTRKIGPCAQELQSASTSLLGTPVPECDYDGYYRPRQCSGSECYCVRKDGTKIGTYSAPIWQKDHITCQCARDKDRFESQGLLGQIHTCRHDGNYQQYQCLGSGCWCTDTMGNRVGTQSVSIADINELKCE